MQLKPRLKNIQKLDIQTGKLEIGKPLLFIYIYMKMWNSVEKNPL